MSLHLARDFKKGFTEPVCQRCRSKGNITCPGCRKYRRPAGTNAVGQVVCQQCLVTDSEAFICPKCGHEGRRYSARRCEDCYWRDTLEERVKAMVSLLREEWVQNAFSSFAVDLAERLGGKVVALKLERYFLFFAKLEATFGQPSMITADKLATVFGADGLRRFSIPYGYLLTSGLISRPSTDSLDQAHEHDRQNRLIAKISGRWYEDLISRYREHLEQINERYRRRGWVGDKARFIPRTITQNLRAALRFLGMADRLGVASVQQLEQSHLDRFLVDHPGYRNGVRSLVRYLNAKEKLFRKLRLQTIRTGVARDTFLSQNRYHMLLAKWVQADDGAIKESLICLLILLYAQPVNRLVRLRVSDLQRDRSGTFRIAFGKTEIALHDQVGALMDRYLAGRKTLAAMEDDWENEFLFPGRSVGAHLTQAAVIHYLRKYGVSAEQLFATAIYQAYLNGVRHPKVLVRAFGITSTTAVKYLNLIDPRLRDEIEARSSRA